MYIVHNFEPLLFYIASELNLKLSSGSLAFLTITQKLRMLLENISRRVVVNILMNISPSNISLNMLLAKRFHQIHQAVLAAVSINGLRSLNHHKNCHLRVSSNTVLNRTPLGAVVYVMSLGVDRLRLAASPVNKIHHSFLRGLAYHIILKLGR